MAQDPHRWLCLLHGLDSSSKICSNSTQLWFLFYYSMCSPSFEWQIWITWHILWSKIAFMSPFCAAIWCRNTALDLKLTNPNLFTFFLISLSPLSLATDVTDATLGAIGLWLGTRTGAGDTATLTESFFGRSPWLHGHQDFLSGEWSHPTPYLDPILLPVFFLLSFLLSSWRAVRSYRKD